MSAHRVTIIESPDGEILIDGKPTDFAPPWKTEDAIRQQSADIAELRAELAAAVAARDWQIQATKAAIESCNQATTVGLAAVAERDRLALLQQEAIANEIDSDEELQDLRAYKQAVDSAPVVACVIEISRDFASGPHRTLVYCNDKLPKHGTELIAKPAKD